MIFIIMMYSTAIPIMYVCGFVIFSLSYWTDKILFLRLYKVPPRYGLHLAFGTQIVMEWSILLHLFIGIYMISNPDIFNFNNSEKVKTSLLRKYGTIVSNWWNWLFGTDQKRLEQLHTIIYLIGTFIFLVCFIIERVFGLFSALIEKLCCCIKES